MKKRVVDLFCGCGGLSLGFQKAGFEIVSAFDNWNPAVETYKKNFNHPVIKKDLFEEDSIDIIKQFSPNIIIGGPPCQDFSIAGKRQEGKRANLTIRFAEIVSCVKPDIFVMENVYNIEKMPVLKKAIDLFENAGYQINKRVLDASFCGCPQKRNRFVMIGYLNKPHHSIDEVVESLKSKRPLTVRDYCGDLINTDFYYMHPRSYKRRAIFSIDEPSSTIRGVNRPMPINYEFHPADKCKDKTIIRPLTTIERSYIQTFPIGFSFVGTKTEIEQMIGNAVPVNLGKFIGKVVFGSFYED